MQALQGAKRMSSYEIGPESHQVLPGEPAAGGGVGASMAELLAAARSMLQARTAAAVNSLRPMPEELPYAALSDHQFPAVEASLASRSEIIEACQAIAARSSCTSEAAAAQLVMTARTRHLTLLEAARDELGTGQEKSSS